MPHTNTTKEAAGASNTNGLHTTDANKSDLHSHGSLNQVDEDLPLITTTTGELGAPQSIMIRHTEWTNQIVCYSLLPSAKQTADLLRGGDNA